MVSEKSNFHELKIKCTKMKICKFCKHTFTMPNDTYQS